MAPTDKTTKETLNHEVEQTDKEYDEKVVLQETKADLMKLKEDISYATRVLEELKKTGWVDEQKFQTLDTKLRDTEHKQEAINEIAAVVDDIYAKYDTLETDQKEKIKTMTETLKKSKLSLSGLKDEVIQKTTINYETIENELVTDATEKLNEHRYSSWLVEPYKKYVHEKIDEMKNGKKNEEKNNWEKFVASLKDWFFGFVGTMFIGKKIADIVAEKIQKYKEPVKEKIEKVKNTVVETAEEAKDKIEKLKKKTPEQLKEDLLISKKYIKNFAKKYAHKDLTDEQLERITKKMNLSQELKDGTSGWHEIIEKNRGNYLDATVQAVLIPGKVGIELIGVLEEEGIIDMKQIGINIVGNTVEYGLKGFELFGSGLAVLIGKMDIKELHGHLAHLYEKSPMAAKYLLFGLIYRSMDGPLMRLVTNTGEFMAKSLVRPLFQAKDDIGTVKDVVYDAAKGNMNTSVKQMRETQDLIKKFGIKDPWLSDLVKETGDAVETYEKYNKALVKVRSLPDNASVIDEMKSLFAGDAKMQSLLGTYKKANTKTEFLSWLGGEWEKSATQISQTFTDSGVRWGVEFKNRGSKVFIGDNSARHVIVDFARNVEAQGKTARKLLSNINLFGNLSDKMYIKRMRSINQVMHGNEIKDKAVWKFNSVEELDDFAENAKLLARKAPGTLKFLLGKSPIFIVAGLSMSEGETMGEKMHSLREGMMGLVPIIGPVLILRDGLWAGDKTNRGEAAVGGALIGVDAVHIIKSLRSSERATKLVHMFTRPVMDMVEIARFIKQTGKNTIRMVSDGVRLVREGKTIGLGEKMLESIKAVPNKKRAMMAAVAAFVGWAGYELMPKGMDKEAEVFFTKYKDDPDGLDKALAENRPTFDQDTKNECLKYAVIAKLGISPDHADNMDVEYKAGTYVVSLPVMIQKEYGNAMLASLQDSIVRVEPNAKIEMEVRGLVAYNFRKNLEEKLKNEGVKPEDIDRTVDEQLTAMGYDSKIGKETNS